MLTSEDIKRLNGEQPASKKPKRRLPMTMFNRYNLIAAIISGLLIVLMLALPVKSETLTQIEGIFPNHDVEFFDEFEIPGGTVQSYKFITPNDYCETNIENVISDTGMMFVDVLSVMHPLMGVPVTSFYFSVTSEAPYQVMIMFSAIAGQPDACLDIVMIRLDEGV